MIDHSSEISTNTEEYYKETALKAIEQLNISKSDKILLIGDCILPHLDCSMLSVSLDEILDKKNVIKENCFDLIIVTDSLNKVVEPKIFFNILTRLCKPGGYLLLSDITADKEDAIINSVLMTISDDFFRAYRVDEVIGYTAENWRLIKYCTKRAALTLPECINTEHAAVLQNIWESAPKDIKEQFQMKMTDRTTTVIVRKHTLLWQQI